MLVTDRTSAQEVAARDAAAAEQKLLAEEAEAASALLAKASPKASPRGSAPGSQEATGIRDRADSSLGLRSRRGGCLAGGIRKPAAFFGGLSGLKVTWNWLQ